jgi:hypothetical protein
LQTAWTIADVFFNLDSLVIETYQELMGVLLGITIVVVGARLACLSYRKRRPSASRKIAAKPPAIAAPAPAARMLEADAQQFNRLANMISTFSQRAEHVSATQGQAALKLDTVEMAMHRLRTDVDGLVNLPKHMPPPAPAAVAPIATVKMSTPRATRAA